MCRCVYVSVSVSCRCKARRGRFEASSLMPCTSWEGLRHLLLCRVLLGKPEQIVSGSKQTQPSSNEFDSGVDDLENPRKYVVWSSAMNSYILPSYIVSFRSPRFRVIGRGATPARPSSPWVSFAALMSMLSKSMDASRMNLISELEEEEQEQVLSLWLHRYTACSSFDWPKEGNHYTACSKEGNHEVYVSYLQWFV
ncbi:probable inactive poly [ADP-ribose] polymerase SRO2 [Raphanus sativus]|uniref:Probable inactive poly [ADP-ribose] polymerase SRO2 n=1 Tax=Raphanus sativus TaxID=3726 RepID=A0A9W3BRH3_RAPSA|nr:probable inactive poly [ADP-ribose] polymerase SRO2 [Raphanus sativus]